MWPSPACHKVRSRLSPRTAHSQPKLGQTPLGTTCFICLYLASHLVLWISEFIEFNVSLLFLPATSALWVCVPVVDLAFVALMTILLPRYSNSAIHISIELLTQDWSSTQGYLGPKVLSSLPSAQSPNGKTQKCVSVRALRMKWRH